MVALLWRLLTDVSHALTGLVPGACTLLVGVARVGRRGWCPGGFFLGGCGCVHLRSMRGQPPQGNPPN
jgi:hypothetical protein